MLSYLGPAYHHILYEMIQYYAACFVLNKPWHRQQQNDSITEMALSRSSKESFSPHPILFKIVRKLFIVPDHCLPASASLESTHSYHSLTYNP